MSEWKAVTLGQISTQRKGINYKSEDYCDENSGHPFLTIKCFVKGGGYAPTGIKFYDGFSTKADHLVPGDIIFSVTDLTRAGDIVGSPLKVPDFGVAKPVLASMDCMRIEPVRERCSKHFLFHRMMLSDVRRQMVAYSAGSTVLHLDTKKVSTISVRIPTNIRTQQKIAAILDGIDTAIEKTEALIEKYQQIKAGLMHDLFTRGVLPNGTLRPPRTEAPELYQETAIGWIPREWKVERAGDLCSIITKGTTPSSTDMWEGQDGVRFLRVDNLSFDGQFNFDASSYRISTQTHTVLLARSMCIPGDVLMNIVGPPLGKVALVTQNVGAININQAIAIFRPKAELSSLFLLRWLISDSAKRWILQRAKQTSGQLNVTLAMCQDLALPHMSVAEQQRIEARIQGAELLVQSESNRRTKLQRQKLGLMQDLLTGKVPVTTISNKQGAT